ncbi:MAG: lipid-A-disaccharide synthase N-terminal domain-containing protein [Muribaculaceae bacterium]|nr:lipid-A-disaccharide synthase N-terminal domain-containing protein [Muribaculaceae bacterium]
MHYEFLIGFLAQGFFSARILVQWIMSERARKVLSPSVFWILSIIGSYLLCLYGVLRQDFAIVLGQFISYYVYLWNLKAKGIWGRMNLLLKILLAATPLAALALAASHADIFIRNFFHNADVPMWLLIFGSTGQIIFTLRFIYQYWYSSRRGESELPPIFWILSLIGSLSIVTYGIIRHDPVLIIGQSFGLVAYIRNLMIGARKKSVA